MLKILIVGIAIFALFSADARADVDFGVNVDWNKFENAENGDWGLGARLDFGGQLRGMLTFDYFFTDAEDLFDDDQDADLDLSFWEGNANIIYEFPTAPVHPYFGGGVGFARRTFNDVDDLFDDERTEFGVNVLGGMKFGHAVVEPFVEVRGTFYPDDEDDIDPDDPFDTSSIGFGDRIIVSAGIVF